MYKANFHNLLFNIEFSLDKFTSLNEPILGFHEDVGDFFIWVMAGFEPGIEETLGDKSKDTGVICVIG